MGRVGACVKVLGEQLLALQVGAGAAGERSEFFRREALVDLAPPDFVSDLGLVDDEFVLHRAAGVHAGGDHQRTVCGQLALVAAHRLGNECGRQQVGVYWA